jgi:hypothetical protein
LWKTIATETVFSEYFGFALSVSLHQFSIPIFTYTLLLPGQTGEAWKPSKKQWFLGNGEH